MRTFACPATAGAPGATHGIPSPIPRLSSELRGVRIQGVPGGVGYVDRGAVQAGVKLREGTRKGVCDVGRLRRPRDQNGLGLVNVSADDPGLLLIGREADFTQTETTGHPAANLVDLSDRHGDWEVLGESVRTDRLAHSTEQEPR